jgi:pteridine reductase
VKRRPKRSSSKAGKDAANAPVALITGAGVRLGRAMALALASDGYDLLLHYRSSRKEVETLAKEVQALGRRTRILQADLSSEAQTLRLAKRAWAAFGRIDLLVNSAAIFWPTPLEKQGAEELAAFHTVNLKAPYLLCSEIGRAMKRRGTGAIVNFACLSAFRAWRAYLPYSISKAGVVSLTEGFAKLLSPEVRVNAIAPGTVLPPAGMARSETEALRKRLPLQRLGSPQDIVKALRYLNGADFVTGQVLRVDGGRSLL